MMMITKIVFQPCLGLTNRYNHAILRIFTGFSVMIVRNNGEALMHPVHSDLHWLKQLKQ